MNNNIKRQIEALKKTAKEIENLDNGENSYSTLWEKYSKARIYLDNISNKMLQNENYRDFRIIEDILSAY